MIRLFLIAVAITGFIIWISSCCFADNDFECASHATAHWVTAYEQFDNVLWAIQFAEKHEGVVYESKSDVHKWYVQYRYLIARSYLFDKCE